MQTHAEVTVSPDQTDRYIIQRDEVEKGTRFKMGAHLQPDAPGQFPQGRRIGVNAMGWDTAEIER